MRIMANGVPASAAGAAMAVLALALLLALRRLMKGPGVADRVIALDLMSTIAVGMMAAYSVVSGQNSVLDAALIVALIAFLGTVAFASFLERGGERR